MLFLTLLPHIVEERADFGAAARHFVDAFWADKASGQLTKDQKSKLQREQLNEFRRRYGSGRRSSIFFLAKENDEILGCAGLEIEREATMSNLAVAVAGRRQGLAQALVKTCEQRTRDAGLTELGLVVEERNKRARALYEKLGYSAVSRDTLATTLMPLPDGRIVTAPTTTLTMRRNLLFPTMPFLTPIFSALAGFIALPFSDLARRLFN